MKKITAIIVSVMLFQITIAQENKIICGQVDPNTDFHTNIIDTCIKPIISEGSAGGIAGYSIDIDGNSVPDYIIYASTTMSGGGSNFSYIESLNSNNEVCFFIHHDSLPEGSGNPPTFYYFDRNIVTIFSLGDTVDNRFDFSVGQPIEQRLFFSSINSYFHSDLWLNIGEKYIGIRMQVNDAILYGWILIEFVNHAEFIVKEFACNKNPYIGITPNQAMQVFELYPNPAKNEVFIKLNGKNNGKSGTFALYDLSGKKLMHAEDIPKNGRIALPALAKGLYVAEIEVEGQKYSRKLQIE